MPRPLIMALLLVTALSLVPLGYFYRARHTDSTRTRIQVVYDMDDQPRPGTQAESAVFADGRASRASSHEHCARRASARRVPVGLQV